MSENEQILNQLVGKRIDVLNLLLNTKITDELALEYQNINTERSYRARDDDPGVAILLQYMKDETLNIRFNKAVKNIAKLSDNLIVEEFCTCMRSVFKLMKENCYELSIQALFIEYDYYGHKHAWIGGFGKWGGWEKMNGERYFTGDWYQDKIFELGEGITFRNAWPDQVETEFEKIDDELGFDISNRLMNLFQLNSRVLFHYALQQLDKEGELNFLKVIPFYFYINEHDCEVSSLYVKGQ